MSSCISFSSELCSAWFLISRNVVGSFSLQTLVDLIQEQYIWHWQLIKLSASWLYIILAWSQCASRPQNLLLIPVIQGKHKSHTPFQSALLDKKNYFNCTNVLHALVMDEGYIGRFQIMICSIHNKVN